MKKINNIVLISSSLGIISNACLNGCCFSQRNNGSKNAGQGSYREKSDDLLENYPTIKEIACDMSKKLEGGITLNLKELKTNDNFFRFEQEDFFSDENGNLNKERSFLDFVAWYKKNNNSCNTEELKCYTVESKLEKLGLETISIVNGCNKGPICFFSKCKIIGIEGYTYLCSCDTKKIKKGDAFEEEFFKELKSINNYISIEEAENGDYFLHIFIKESA